MCALMPVASEWQTCSAMALLLPGAPRSVSHGGSASVRVIILFTAVTWHPECCEAWHAKGTDTLDLAAQWSEPCCEKQPRLVFHSFKNTCVS